MGDHTITLVRDLADGVPDIFWMAVAAHEIGHALVADYYDIPIQDARMSTSMWDGHLTGGVTRTKNGYEIEEEDETLMDGHLSVLLAGNEAGAYCLSTYLGYDMSQARDIESSGSDAGPGSDFVEFRRLRRYGNTPEKILQLNVERFVRHNWPSIDRFAAKLARKRVLSGASIS